MTRYQWFKENCLSRRLVDYLFYIMCYENYKRKNRLISTLHHYKVSLNRIIFIHNRKNTILVEYYSRRKNKYSGVIFK